MKSLVLAVALLASSASAQRPNAAMVIGGYQRATDEGLNKVELFGCEGYDSIELDSFPTAIELSAGVQYPEGEDVVVMCGGTATNPTSTDPNNPNPSVVLTDDCYWFVASNAEGERWVKGQNLPANKASHGMFKVKNTDTASDEMVPLVLGQGRQPYIFNPAADLPSGTWTNYIDTVVRANIDFI